MFCLRYKFSCFAALAAFHLTAWIGPGVAHVDWTRTNAVQSGITVGLYHFDEHETGAGDTLQPAPGLPSDRGLLIQAPSGLGMLASHDTPEGIFDPHSLSLNSAQIADSTEVVDHLDGDLTIEFWFKWDPTLTYQVLRVGLHSGAKIEIARNTVTSASDTFGIQFVHGDFVSAPGFTNWVDVGEEEAGVGEWYHVALTIHSTGQHFDDGLGHDVYNAGSTARIWLNGHPVGSEPHTVNLEGVRAHHDSRIRVQSVQGAIKIDEVTIWRVDWSQDGANSHPFANGRGESTSSVENWDFY